MSVQPRTARSSSHLGGCAGFWLWALVGAGLVLGFISLGILALIPAVVFAVLLTRWSSSYDWGGVGICLLVSGVVAYAVCARCSS